MKLVTEHSTKFGQKNIVPHLGLIEIAQDGSIDIHEDNEKLALLLVDENIGFSVFSDKPAKVKKAEKDPEEEEEDLKKKAEDDDLGDKSEENDLGHQTDDDTLNETSADPIGSTEDVQDEIEGADVEDVHIEPNTESVFTQEEKDKLIEVVEGKTFQEMKEYATQMAFPTEEWESRINGVQMKKYLTAKILAL